MASGTRPKGSLAATCWGEHIWMRKSGTGNHWGVGTVPGALLRQYAGFVFTLTDRPIPISGEFRRGQSITFTGVCNCGHSLEAHRVDTALICELCGCHRFENGQAADLPDGIRAAELSSDPLLLGLSGFDPDRNPES